MAIHHIDLPTALPAEVRDEFLRRLAYVSEGLTSFELSASGERVTFSLASRFDYKVSLVGTYIAEVAAKLLPTRISSTRIICHQDNLPGSYSEDPHLSLEQMGELHFYGKGRWGLGPQTVELIADLDRLIKRLAEPLGVSDYQFPALIGAEVLDQCRYLRNFPSSLTLVAHLREDLGRLQAFSRTAHYSVDHLEFDDSAAARVKCLLSPSVCFHWYSWLANQDVSEPRTITAIGKCFRYESANLKGLERLWDFSMREIIFVGPAEYVLAQRQKCIGLATTILDQLGLAYEISTATDPFFIDSYAVQAAFQQGFELKYELLCKLPYGDRNLAVGSINYHQDFFGRAFEIQAAAASAHTGCLGFGLERLALAVLAQYGPFEAWPQKLKHTLAASEPGRLPLRHFAASE